MEKSHLAIVGKLFSPSRTIFELAQGLLDSNTSEQNCSFEALVQREALTICQDKVVESFLCVLSLSSVLGKFLHYSCIVILAHQGGAPPPLLPYSQYICCKHIYIIKDRENPQSEHFINCFQVIKVKILINVLVFFDSFLDVPSAALQSTLTVFSK